jgi:seryl-tRNA synthetase
MPLVRHLIDRREEYLDLLKAKNAPALIPAFEEGIELFSQWKAATTKAQELREAINKASDEFKKTKDQAFITKSKELSAELTAQQELEKDLAERIKKVELRLPNWISDDVPRGLEGDEVPLNYQGTPAVPAALVDQFKKEHPGAAFRPLEGEPFHHYNLVGSLIDQEIAGDVAATKFYYEFGDMVILDMALSMYSIEFFRAKGYAQQLMIPPYMMRQEVEEEICYFEAFQDTIFKVKQEGHQDMILLPSSEHAIVAYYREKLFKEEELPLRITAWSPCFRREAGSEGKDTRGIFRVKQFHKVELHSIVKEGEDDAELERLTADIQEFMNSLGLPNRAVNVASGDMDKRAKKQIDIETWMPGQGRYRETHSVATLGTWVSEKSRIRYSVGSGKQKKNLTAVNLYATAVAVQRTLCAIAENHYNPATKTIAVPGALQKYTMGVTEIAV